MGLFSLYQMMRWLTYMVATSTCHWYQMSSFYCKGPFIKQFMDISLPDTIAVLCGKYFLGHGLEFDQVHLYKDVTDATRKCV